MNWCGIMLIHEKVNSMGTTDNTYTGKKWVDDWNDDSFGNFTQHLWSPITEKHYALICADNREIYVKALRQLADYYDRSVEEKLPQGGSVFAFAQGWEE